MRYKKFTNDELQAELTRLDALLKKTEKYKTVMRSNRLAASQKLRAVSREMDARGI